MGRPSGRMAVIAGRRQVDPAKSSLAVHAAFVHLDRPAIKEIMFLGQVEVLMAAPAGLRKMERIDLRFPTAGGKDIMCAMTVGAARYVTPVSHFEAAMPLIGLGLIAVTVAAVDSWQRLLMRQLLYGCMAIDAGHLAMDRLPVGTFINKKGYFFSLPLGGQIRIFVAGQTVVIRLRTRRDARQHQHYS